MFYGDSLGFLGGRGGPITVEKELKLDLVHLTAVPPWVDTMEETLKEIEKFKKMILSQPRLRLITNQKDLSSAVVDKKVAVILGMQNTPKDMVECESVLKLKEAGVRIIAPCYDEQNILGSGWFNSDFGLSNEGYRFIRDCACDRIIVDLSHSSHKMARDIISYAKESSYTPKIMASHGGCYSRYHHFRNLPDDVFKRVVELGGIVGISTLTFTNHECDNSVFPFKDHLAHAISLCGQDSVCVGSDDLYITRDTEEARKQFQVMSKKLDPLGTQGARFPENPLSVMGPDMLEKLYKFCLPYFPVGTSEKVFGQNLFNFLNGHCLLNKF